MYVKQLAHYLACKNAQYILAVIIITIIVFLLYQIHHIFFFEGIIPFSLRLKKKCLKVLSIQLYNSIKQFNPTGF